MRATSSDLAEDRKLLQHEPDLAIRLDQPREVGRAFPAIRAIIVEKGDDAHIPLRVAGDEARRRAEDLPGMGGDPPLLPHRAHIAKDRIGHDQAQEPGKPNENKQT